MAGSIVQSSEIITLLGAGPVRDEVLDESLNWAPRIVAADGGARKALAVGTMPQAVIGDFDSLDATTKGQLSPDQLIAADDQNLTDFDKALKVIQSPLILAVGFTGGRLDHELAVYSALIQHRGNPVIVLGDIDIAFHLRRPLSLTLPVETRVSLFPMASVRCTTNGLRWPTNHLQFEPWGRVGTSNETISPEITMTPSGPGMLVILPRSSLAHVIPVLIG